MSRMPRDLITIPKTTPKRYVSGIVALNIPSETGTGDWHFDLAFRKHDGPRPLPFMVGEGQGYDTTVLLGDAGVFECSAILDRIGVPHEPGPVYAANHARAIADMVLGSVMRGNTALPVTLDDWMPRTEDKAAVLRLLQIAESRLDSNQRARVNVWVGKNSTHDQPSQRKFNMYAMLEKKRRMALTTAIKRTRFIEESPGIKSNSELWMEEHPKSVSEAIELSDRIENSIREWTER